MSDNAALEARVKAALDATGLAFEWLDCDPNFADTAKFCEVYDIPMENSGNTIIVASKKAPKTYCACVVTAVTRLDVNKKVRKLMGVRKVSFASAEETKELTGMLIGGVTPLDLPKELCIYVDSRIRDLDYVILGGGSRSKKVKISPEIFSMIDNCQFVDELAKDPS